MLTVFERVPDVFVEMYDAEFRVWAAEFRRRGVRQAIEFRRRPGVPVLLDGEGRPIVAGAWLEAEVDLSRAACPRVVIRPASAADEEAIARHCREMRSHVLQ